MTTDQLDCVENYLKEHRTALERVTSELAPEIVRAANQLVRTVTSGGQVLICGNGGSAADAQHFAAELVGRFRRERQALPAVALTTDTSALTAIGNDYGFTYIFSRQVEALASRGDVLVGISTSGHSSNVLEAVRAARDRGCATIGLLGRDGGTIAAEVDLALVVPAEATSHVQEAHIVIIHLLCELVERAVIPAQD